MYVPPTRVGSLAPTAVNRILQEVGQVQTQGREVLTLMRGQPDTRTPNHIVEAAKNALDRGRTGYADNAGEPRLRDAVSQYLSAQFGLPRYSNREILITDGATGGISTALAALVQPGDAVLVPDPIYDAYASPIQLWGGSVVSIPSRIDKGRFVLDRSTLEAAYVPRAKVLLLNSPWNPVGTVFTSDELAAILEFARAHDLFVLSDEIYQTLIYDGRRHVSPATLSEDARARTLVVSSLSKTYGMTGWRVGYCAGPEALISAMLLVLQQGSRGPATFVQDAAACALTSSQDCVRQMMGEYEERRNHVVGQLREVPGVLPLVPEGGLFVMLDVRRLNASSDVVRRRLLHEHGVAVIHGAAYGPSGEGMLRVSFAAGGQALERGLDRLCTGLAEMAKGVGS